MRRRNYAIIIALGVAYGGILGLLLLYGQQRDGLQSLRSEIAATRQLIEASKTAATIPTPPAQPSAAATTYARIRSAADNLGNVWTPGAAVPAKASLPGVAVVTLTAQAEGPSGRSLQYKFWTGQLPKPLVLCDWGGPSCSWSPAQLSNACTAGTCAAQITIGVRVASVRSRLENCFQTEGCDDIILASYLWHSG